MSDQNEKPLHVVSLTVENVKRVRAVRISPDPAASTVILSGRNAQGKSSVIDAMEMALGGGRSIPAEPVRHGARRARTVLDLGDLVVERTFSKDGTKLEVRGADGVPKASPQKLLDSLCARETFDPVAFVRMEPSKQDEVLRKALGLDFSDLDAARAKVYEQRKETNREVKRLEALLDSQPEHRDAPKEAIDVAETAALLTAATDHNAGRKEHLRRIEIARRDLADQDSVIAQTEKRIAAAQLELEEHRKYRETMLAKILEAERATPEEKTTRELQERLRTAETTNVKVRSNAERKKTEAELKKHEAAAQGFTDTIQSLDDEKAERLAEAKFPIDGLGFDELGPTLHGVPLAQASQAQKLRLSVALAAAQNPRVKVAFVREGSFLDREGMQTLAELAAETGLQVWVERVQDDAPGAIVIEDGEVAGGAAETAAE